MKKPLLIVFLTLIVGNAFSQFSLTGEIKPKAEYRYGYKTLPSDDDKPAGFVGQRTRLNLSFKHSKLITHISLQDVRMWGQELQKEHYPSIAIHEAWAELLLKDSFALKAGRQHIYYDNQRFFSINNWNLSGQKHDAFLLKHSTKKTDLHFGNAFNQSGYNTFGTEYGLNNYKFLSFLWFKIKLGEKNYASFTAVADGYEKQTNHEILYVRGTYSGFLSYYFGNINLTFNPAFQNGKTKSGKDISAYYALADINIPVSEKYKLLIGGEYFSGNDYTKSDDKVFRAFDPLFGAAHNFNGYMDYFTYPANTKYAGLINPYIKNKLKLSDKSNLSVDLHAFLLSNNYVFQNNIINKYLGTEADLTYSFKLNEFSEIALGYSFMMATESMEIIKGGTKDKWAQWAYFMLTVKPKFL
ncbi:MAG: alginate export family protein [Bacteroidetes bacterium]|nr:alginate export family protein [Bacteroidota bacterium]